MTISCWYRKISYFSYLAMKKIKSSHNRAIYRLLFIYRSYGLSILNFHGKLRDIVKVWKSHSLEFRVNKLLVYFHFERCWNFVKFHNIIQYFNDNFRLLKFYQEFGIFILQLPCLPATPEISAVGTLSFINFAISKNCFLWPQDPLE